MHSLQHGICPASAVSFASMSIMIADQDTSKCACACTCAVRPRGRVRVRLRVLVLVLVLKCSFAFAFALPVHVLVLVSTYCVMSFSRNNQSIVCWRTSWAGAVCSSLRTLATLVCCVAPAALLLSILTGMSRDEQTTHSCIIIIYG